ncbi:hypothetical protein, partial [Burkholderia multivorans]|uniref:hypothetical protein n=1 Tax=Burkholderia multivorans TaxID=87883 RepID=UPI001C612346
SVTMAKVNRMLKKLTALGLFLKPSLKEALDDCFHFLSSCLYLCTVAFYTFYCLAYLARLPHVARRACRDDDRVLSLYRSPRRAQLNI